MEKMKGISRTAVVLGVGLCALSIAYVLSILAMPHIEYNDVGPAPLFLLALFVLFPLCLVGTFVLPPCTAFVAILGCIALFRDKAKRWGTACIVLCLASAGLLMLGRHIDNQTTEESQPSPGAYSSKAADGLTGNAQE